MNFQDIHRRTFLARRVWNGAAALSTLFGRDACHHRLLQQQTSLGAINPLHHKPRAKSVIFLCLAGGPSHLETFDHKPVLAEQDGQPMPASLTAGQPIAQLQGKELVCLGPRKPFRRFGECGAEISEHFTQLGSLTGLRSFEA